MTTRRTLAITGALLLVPALAFAQFAPTLPATLPAPRAPAAAPVIEPAQPSAEANEMWNAPMFTSGALVFAASYGTSVIVAGSSDHQGDNHLYVPVVGPWLDIADRGPGCPVLSASCNNGTTDRVLLAVDGVFQAAGVLAMIDGVLARAHHSRAFTTTRRDYHITPTTVQNNPGVAVSGHF